MIEAREYQPQDAPGYVEVHNSVWSGDLAIDIEIWERWCQQPTTAAIALEDGKVVGAVPFHLRDFVVRPGLVIRAAFEYSVCVYERLRSQGVGSKMMQAAKQFLPAQADVMMVYRGGERRQHVATECNAIKLMKTQTSCGNAASDTIHHERWAHPTFACFEKAFET